jgi:DNA-binding LytR/AlgR family response regulator
MKRVIISFEQDINNRDIDVLFRASDEDAQVRNLMDRICDPFAGSLTVYDQDGCAVNIPEMNIISISTGDKKLIVMADTDTYELRMPLYEVIELLNPDAFIQISRYEIINLNKVRKFDFSISGTLQVEMAGGMKTWASRRNISEIKKRLKDKETGR